MSELNHPHNSINSQTLLPAEVPFNLFNKMDNIHHTSTTQSLQTINKNDAMEATNCPLVVTRDDLVEQKIDGIYENFNIDYDNDYDQFYDKLPTHYLVDHTNRTIINSGPIIHEVSLDEFIEETDPDDVDQQYFYEDQSNDIGLDQMIQHYHQPELDILSDARTYGLPTFLHQQQQQIQRHMSGSIYGNPLVYSLHTIYEESEDESSLQTNLSSLTGASSTMPSAYFENQYSNSDSTMINEESMTIRNEDINILNNSNNHNGIQKYSIMISKNQEELINNDSTYYKISGTENRSSLNNYDEDEYEEEYSNQNEDLDLVDTLNSDLIVSDTLFSKLERYFTSGLLETSSTIHQDQHQPITKSLTKSFDKIGSLYNFLNEMISDSLPFEELSEHLDRLSWLFKMDFKRFIIQIISSLQKNVDNERNRFLIEELIEKLLQQYQKCHVEKSLISIMISIYSLTQLDYLLFDHRLWKDILRRILNKPKINDISIQSNQTGKTIIKVIVNGRLLAPMEQSKNVRKQNSITILNTESEQMVKNPEYRTILHINNVDQKKLSKIDETIEFNEDNDDNDNERIEENPNNNNNDNNNNTNRLNKFLRVTNPLNQSFLAKISPIKDGTKSEMNNGEVDRWATMVDSIDSNQQMIDVPPKQCCSVEKIHLRKIYNNDQANNNDIIIPESNGQHPKVINNINSHRNSFRSFSNSTLDHIYEIFKNPFKSSKKKKKSNNTVQQGSSKSLSEPNLNGSTSKRQHQQQDQNKNSQNSISNLNRIVDFPSNQDDYDDLHLDEVHSKSTPQLVENKSQTKNLLFPDQNRSWTGSWDRRLHHSNNHNNVSSPHNQKYRNSARQSKNDNLIGNHDELQSHLRMNGGQSTVNIKSHLQRSLSGSNTSSMAFSTFQRPKSCIVFGGSNYGNSKFSSHSSYSNTNANSIRFQRNNINNTSIFSYKFKNHLDSDDINNEQLLIVNKMPWIGKVCLSIYYEAKLNSLTITIFRCHLNIFKKHKNDLYIKVYVLSDQQTEKAFKKKTKIRKSIKIDTCDGPVYEVEYNEILRFNGKWKEFAKSQLSVSLWNNDTFGRNTLLGQVMIRLNEQMIENSIQTRTWHDLLQETKIKYPSVHVKGNLFLAIKFETKFPIHRLTADNGYKFWDLDDGDLHVLIKEADELNFNQYNINGHVYCKLMLKPKRMKDDYQKTKLVKAGQNPRWNDTLTFKDLNKRDLIVKELEIAIIWQDKSSKIYLGSLRLADYEDSTNEERNVWKQMIDRQNLWAYGKIPLRH